LIAGQACQHRCGSWHPPVVHAVALDDRGGREAA